MKFEIGKLFMTRAVSEDMAENSQFAKEIHESMSQYKNCNWGTLCEEDKKLNDDAVKNGDDRILAKYKTCSGNIYIITEADRSMTTILFCEEY